jgi:Xaa-Pro aminopeptidase
MEGLMTTLKPISDDQMPPRLSRAERDRRWGLVRAQMALGGLDALLVWGNDRSTGNALANMRYLTQIASFAGVAVFPLVGAPLVFAGSTHTSFPSSPFLEVQDWVEAVRPFTGVRAVAEALREMGLERGRIGLVGYGLHGRDIITYQEYQALTSALPAAALVDATPILNLVRLKKSAEELQLLARAGDVARGMLTAMTESAQPGRRESEVFARMVHEQLRLGGEPFVFLMLSSGQLGGPRLLVHAVGPPYAPAPRILQDNDLLITEFHGSYAGYLVGVEASLFLGTPPRELQALYDVAAASLATALDVFRPGASLRQVWEAMRRPVQEARYDFVELGFHGHGLGSPEFPTVVHAPGKGSMDGRGIGDFLLEPDMVFGLNIDIHDPNWRTDVGVMLGDTVVVTSDAPRPLVGVQPRLARRAV